jgi:hypothetical protein
MVHIASIAMFRLCCVELIATPYPVASSVNKVSIVHLLLLLHSDNGSAMVYKGGSRCLHYRVKSPRIEVSNIIKDVFETSDFLKDSWVELPTGLGLGVSWNILWVSYSDMGRKHNQVK